MADSPTQTTPACEPRPEAVARFQALRTDFLDDFYRRQPTLATYLGLHDFDAELEDYSAEAAGRTSAAAERFKRALEAFAPGDLGADDELDRLQLLASAEATIVRLDRVRHWATAADHYSSGLTNSAYALVKRSFAPPAERMRALIARLRAMPAELDHARRNLEQPPRTYTQIAIQQIDGNRAFFESAVPAAFADVDDPRLQAELHDANTAVIAALAAYKVWLQTELLPRSQGDFAFGADTFRRCLAAEEMIEIPLERLLRMAESDLAKNRAAFEETARKLDPRKTPSEVLADVERHRPQAAELIAATQGELDALAAFLVERSIVTVPEGAPVRVKETPPFLRATTSASIEIPGPFERVATEAYYNVTLPDPAWSAAEQDEFMRQWYYPAITNVSAHEVWPGHHLQFLHARRLASDVRKVFGVATNVEGWAHYAEQMVIDEGFRGDDPRYRLAQLQDALLRDARFVVGIRMHTGDMSIEEAEQFFLTRAYQTPHVSRIEARRGTFDATYGYYTLGKLLVTELRDDYRAALGPAYTLRRFHDAFMAAGPLPLPLARRVLLADVDQL